MDNIKIVTDDALLQSVDRNLLARYEKMHPEIGTVDDLKKEIQAFNKEKEMHFRAGIGACALLGLLALIFLVLVAKIPPVTGHRFALYWFVGWVILAAVLYHFLTVQSKKIEDKYIPKTFELAHLLKVINILCSGTQGTGVCNEAYVHARLIDLAAAVLMNEAECAQRRLALDIPLDDVVAAVANVHSARAAFDVVYVVAIEDFGLEYSRRELFAQAEQQL